MLCVPLTGERCDALGLPLMVEDNTEVQRTAFTVTTDARTGITTGISAADRARTISLLGDPESERGDFVRPGHIFPLRARPGGVLERTGHTCGDAAPSRPAPRPSAHLMPRAEPGMR